MAADKYQVLGLVALCSDHLARTISKENAVELFHVGYFISSATELKSLAMWFICKNYKEVKEATPDQLTNLIEQHPRDFEKFSNFWSKNLKKNESNMELILIPNNNSFFPNSNFRFNRCVIWVVRQKHFQSVRLNPWILISLHFNNLNYNQSHS